jgi:uncharacterized protein
VPLPARLSDYALTMPRVVFLHGFGSSPQSSKGAFLRRRLAENGIALETPDLNQPDFSTLTISRMLGQVSRVLDEGEGGPAALIGSSLGGFVAVQTAIDHPANVSRLVLLAPALDFSAERVGDLGDRSVEEWRATNRLDVFHHAYGRVMPMHYELFADAQRFDPLGARLDLPMLIFQGRRDTAVDPATVERWASAQPHAVLHLLDDDHQLHASLDFIWAETARALGLTPAPSRPPDAAPRV